MALWIEAALSAWESAKEEEARRKQRQQEVEDMRSGAFLREQIRTYTGVDIGLYTANAYRLDGVVFVASQPPGTPADWRSLHILDKCPYCTAEVLSAQIASLETLGRMLEDFIPGDPVHAGGLCTDGSPAPAPVVNPAIDRVEAQVVASIRVLIQDEVQKIFYGG